MKKNYDLDALVSSVKKAHIVKTEKITEAIKQITDDFDIKCLLGEEYFTVNYTLLENKETIRICFTTYSGKEYVIYYRVKDELFCRESLSDKTSIKIFKRKRDLLQNLVDTILKYSFLDDYHSFEYDASSIAPGMMATIDLNGNISFKYVDSTEQALALRRILVPSEELMKSFKSAVDISNEKKDNE